MSARSAGNTSGRRLSSTSTSAHTKASAPFLHRRRPLSQPPRDTNFGYACCAARRAVRVGLLHFPTLSFLDITFTVDSLQPTFLVELFLFYYKHFKRHFLNMYYESFFLYSFPRIIPLNNVHPVSIHYSKNYFSNLLIIKYSL